jgi:hypothetical protein
MNLPMLPRTRFNNSNHKSQVSKVIDKHIFRLYISCRRTEKTEGAIKNGQSREDGQHYTQANTNNVNKICPPTTDVKTKYMVVDNFRNLAFMI